MREFKIDVEYLKVTGAKLTPGPNAPLTRHSDVIVVVNQAFGPTGKSLMGITDVTFDGCPAITILVRALGREELVNLSPIHGDSRKQGFDGLPMGTKCELLCPRSGQRLDKIGRVVSQGEAEYHAIYLTPRLDRGSMLYISDLWGHHHSRIVDNNELISYWAAAEDRQQGATG